MNIEFEFETKFWCNELNARIVNVAKIYRRTTNHNEQNQTYSFKMQHWYNQCGDAYKYWNAVDTI